MIDAAIRAANRGLMRRLTDLSLETIRLDAHASSLWQKRLNRLAALPWKVEPATGDGIDEARAEDYAGFVRDQLDQIPNFRQCLMDINTAHYHGRACSEVEWDLHRAVWRARDLHWIHPRRLSFGPDRDVRIIDLTTEIGNFEDQGFPVQRVPYKFVTFTPRVFGDYAEREGLAPRAVFWSFFARMGVRERLHLMEIWGKPWRIAYPELDANNPTGINQEQIDDAYDALNSLGGQATAVLPIAMKILIPQPSKGAGDVHDAAIDHAEKSMSKLFVGATGTTDAVSTGLGSSIGDIHASEEDLVIAMDAFRLSEVIEDLLTDAIIIVNFGPEAVSHAPKFRLATDPPMDRKAEVDLLKGILDLGLDVSMAEARERVGVREIKSGEAFLRRVPRLVNGAPPFYSPMPEQIYPTGEHPDAGTIPNVPTVEGGPAPVIAPPAQPPPRPGAPPQLPPGGAPPPQLPAPAATATDDEPTDASIAELAAKMTEHAVERCQHGKSNRCRLCGIERERDFTVGEDGQLVLGDDGQPVWHVKWRPIGATRAPKQPGEELEEESSKTIPT
jgi:phage gp29-like protein